MFNISDKVVCVDDSNPLPENSYPNGYIKRGQIYVVSGLSNNNGTRIVGFPVFSIDGYEVGWKSKRFRKLSEIKEENKLHRKTIKANELLNVNNFSTPQINKVNNMDSLKEHLRRLVDDNRI